MNVKKNTYEVNLIVAASSDNFARWYNNLAKKKITISDCNAMQVNDGINNFFDLSKYYASFPVMEDILGEEDIQSILEVEENGLWSEAVSVEGLMKLHDKWLGRDTKN